MTTRNLAKAWSVALVGLDGRLVEVEAHIGGGLPRTVLVGLPDASLYEARDRCKAAVANSGQNWPSSLLTINLSPATLPKAGSAYDLAIVAAVLAADQIFGQVELARTVLLGELGLDGRVRPVRGVLPAVLAAAQAGFSRVIVPARQAAEARLVQDIDIVGVSSLACLVALLKHEPIAEFEDAADAAVADDALVPALLPALLPAGVRTGADAVRDLDLSDVVGQVEAKWALEVAAAGRHHVLFTGPPGVGKTMLAERLPTLLPDLEPSESVEVSAVHSLAGIDLSEGLLVRPPYADPHHSASIASIVGGGARLARPGAISCAHRGVLFLDEAPEFPKPVLEALRTPLESGMITIGRSEAQACYPARFQLVLAANPCPCGLAATPGMQCTCAPMAIRRYADKISGPIKDRIDITQTFRPLRKAFLQQALAAGESSLVVASRVAEARARQAHRLRGTPWQTNGEVPGPYLRKRLSVADGGQLIDDAVHRGRLSSRGVDKVLRLAWSLADLAKAARPGIDEVAAAVAMRRGESSSAPMRVVS
jgi:magnesium chelatase family protein